MNSRNVRAPLAALPLAILATFPALAQSLATTGLSETVVTATRFAQESDTLPIGVSVITAEDIRSSGATTVNEAVMRLLGVVGRLDFYGGGNYSLDLRGFGQASDSNQIIVVDGVRVNEADLAAPRLSGIAIDTVERIEVLRGSGAVLYGEGASGGVIAITTKAGLGKGRRNTAMAYLGAGTHNLRELRASATVVAGGLSVDVSGQRRDSDNHRKNFRSESDASAVSLQWSNDFLRLGVRHSQDQVSTGLPGALSAAQFASDPFGSTGSTDWARIRNSREGLFGEAALGNWQLAADAAWRDKSLRSSTYDYDVDAKNLGLRARHQGTVHGLKNQFTIGQDYNRWARLAYGSASGQSSRAMYLQNDLVLEGGTRMSAGWRTERMEKHANDEAASLGGRQNAWDIAVNQPLSEESRVWLRVGNSYRLANVDEFTFTDPSIAIRPQISRDVESGWSWKRPTYHVQARVYRSVLTDEIGYDPAAANPYGGAGANINFDPTRRQGLELDGDWSLSPTLTGRARLNLRRSTLRSGDHAGKDIPLAPRESLSLMLQWRPAPGQTVGGSLNWVGSQHPDLANQCRMPSHTTVGVRYAYQFDRAEFSVGINNLFDRRYYTLAYACEGSAPTSIYPEAGRTVVASIRFSI